MNQEKKYRRSLLRDLFESVFANLSLSVSPCVQSASNPTFLPQNCFPFISQDPSSSMAHKIRVFNVHVWKRGLRYATTKEATPRRRRLRHYEGGYATTKEATPRRRRLRRGIPEATGIRQSGLLQHRASTLLRRATPQRGVPRCCVPEAPLHFSLLSLLWFFLLLFSFLFYSNIDMS